LTEDYQRPGLAERRRASTQAKLLEQADGATLDGLRELFARPVNSQSAKYELESLTVLARARALLRESTAIEAEGTGVAAMTYETWRAAGVSWLEATEGDDDPDIGLLLAGVSGPSTEPSRIALDLVKPVEVDQAGPTTAHDIWQTVFGYEPPNNLMRSATRTYKRADLPERTYCLLPEWEGGSQAFAVAIEHDRSRRLLVLENYDGSCDEMLPLSNRYLPDVILQDCLGDLMNCTTCFGLLPSGKGSGLSCPSCQGSSRLPVDERLGVAAAEFVEATSPAGTAPSRPDNPFWPAVDQDWGGRVKVFTSHSIREYLANIVQGGPQPRALPVEAVNDHRLDSVGEVDG